MVYLFLLSSCMIVMYNVFVILCLEKRVFNYTNFLYVLTTYYNIFVCVFFSL